MWKSSAESGSNQRAASVRVEGKPACGYRELVNVGKPQKGCESCPLFSCRSILHQFEPIVNMTMVLVRLMLLLSSEQFDFVARSISTYFVFNLHVLSVQALKAMTLFCSDVEVKTSAPMAPALTPFCRLKPVSIRPPRLCPSK
jgi:hypothetical protein